MKFSSVATKRKVGISVNIYVQHPRLENSPVKEW